MKRYMIAIILMLLLCSNARGATRGYTGNFMDKGLSGYNVLAYGATGDGSTDDSAAFISAIAAAAGGRLIIPKAATSYRLSSNVTVPAGIDVVFQQGGLLLNDGGVTFTVNGTLQAGLYQIFSGAGDVSLAAGSVPEVYPQWWGAVGDGSADDTAAVQAAITVCSSAKGFVFFPSGTYLLDTLTMLSNVHLVGDNEATLKLADSADNNNNLIEGSNLSNISIRNLRLNGNKAGQSGSYIIRKDGLVQLLDCSNVRIEYNVIYDARANAILAGDGGENYLIANNEIYGSGDGMSGLHLFYDDGGAASEGINNSRIVDNLIYNNGYGAGNNYGDGIFAASCTGLVISGNICNNNNRIGIVLEDFGSTVASDKITITGNVVSLNSDSIQCTNPAGGIWAETHGNWIISDNYVEILNVDEGIDVAFAGIVVAAYESCIVTGNTVIVVAGESEHAIAVTQSAGDHKITNIEGNTIRGGGIFLHGDVVDTNISNNTIYSSNAGGIEFYTSGTATANGINISGNVIVDPATRGITSIGTYTIEDSVIANNLITNSGSEGIYFPACDNVVVSDNVITDSGSDSIVVGDTVSIIGNIIDSSAARGVYIIETTKALIADNVISNSTSSGIQLNDVSNLELENNIISASGSFGVYLYTISDNENISFTGNTVYNSTNSGFNLQTTSGITTTNLMISDNMLYDDQGSPTQDYGIEFNTTARFTNCYIRDNMIFDNEMGALLAPVGRNNLALLDPNGIGFKQYAGDPNGNVTPHFVGDKCLDITNDIWYTSFGIANTEWTTSLLDSPTFTSLTVEAVSPEITIQNTTEENGDGGREGSIRFKGEQDGGEVTTLVMIRGSHDGSSDDEKGKLEILVNDTNDGSSPTLRTTWNADGSFNHGDGGTTNYIKIAADGTLTLLGTARVTKHVRFAGATFEFGGSAPDNVIVGNYSAWSYDIGDDSAITFELFDDWAPGTDLTIKVDWGINRDYATESAEIQWNATWSAVLHDASEVLTGAGTTIDPGDQNIPTNANTLTRMTLGTISGASLAAGDEIGIKFERVALDTGSDPGGATDPYITHLHIEYISGMLGE